MVHLWTLMLLAESMFTGSDPGLGILQVPLATGAVVVAYGQPLVTPIVVTYRNGAVLLNEWRYDPREVGYACRLRNSEIEAQAALLRAYGAVDSIEDIVSHNEAALDLLAADSLVVRIERTEGQARVIWTSGEYIRVSLAPRCTMPRPNWSIRIRSGVQNAAERLRKVSGCYAFGYDYEYESMPGVDTENLLRAIAAISNGDSTLSTGIAALDRSCFVADVWKASQGVVR